MSASKSTGSTRREDISMKLKLQNMKNPKNSAKLLEMESRKMEERLEELKSAMTRQKEQRIKRGGYWKSGRTGSLNGYAQNVLVTATRDTKAKVVKVRVLKDEPLDVAARDNGPGTMGHIAQRGLGEEVKARVRRCGQCEVKAANLSCVQCSELYCTACYEAFHRKGALQKHRSVSLKANKPRQSRASWSPPEPMNHLRSLDSLNGAAGKEDTEKNDDDHGQTTSLRSPLATDGVGASGTTVYPSLLEGEYNEAESAASFQQALMEWRRGQKVVANTQRSYTGRMERLPEELVAVKPAVTTSSDPIDHFDMATSSDDLKQPEIEVVFNQGTCYSDRLLLKQHRRTDVPPLPSHHYMPTLIGQDQEVLDGSFTGAAHLNFSDIYACVNSTDEGRGPAENSDPPGTTDDYIITDVTDSECVYADVTSNSSYTFQPRFSALTMEPYDPASMRNSFPEYIITDVSDSIIRKTHPQTGCFNQPLSAPDSETGVGDGSNMSVKNTCLNNSLSGRPKSGAHSRAKSDTQTRAVSRALGRATPNGSNMKNRPVSRPQSRAVSRSQSRAVSRSQSRAMLSDDTRHGAGGEITKIPSDSLHEVVVMATKETVHVYTHGLSEVFTSQTPRVGQPERAVPRARHDRPTSGLFPARAGSCKSIKLSNRLYQMSPKSWHPGGSVAEILAPDAVTSNHLSGVIVPVATDDGNDIDDVTDTAWCAVSPRPGHATITPAARVRSTPTPTSGVTSPPSAATRARLTPNLVAKRSSRPPSAVCEIMQSECYDDETEVDMCTESDDAQTIDQLEWELASQSGRLTAEGHVSRMDLLTQTCDGGGVTMSRLHTPYSDCDINLSESELMEDFEEMERQVEEEEEDSVKALH